MGAHQFFARFSQAAHCTRFFYDRVCAPIHKQLSARVAFTTECAHVCALFLIVRVSRCSSHEGSDAWHHFARALAGLGSSRAPSLSSGEFRLYLVAVPPPSAADGTAL